MFTGFYEFIQDEVHRRKRRLRHWAKLRELENKISSEMDAASEGVTDASERELLRMEVWNGQAPLRKLIRHIRQQQLRGKLEDCGVLVPDEFIDSSAPFPLLTEAGENWARREIQKRRDERVEFWMRTLLPVLSLIVSIVAIVISVRR